MLDRGLYALFARHADERRHAADRKRYRGTDLRMSFDVFLARTYGVSWVVYLVVFVPALLVVSALSPSVVAFVDAALAAALPVRTVGLDEVPRLWVGAAVGGVAAIAAKHATVRLGGIYLRWLASARRTAIERTLPGAVRYLNALSSGSDDAREMIAKTAASDAYGATAVSLRKALNTARLTGSLDEGLRRVARDTPSRNLLAPFLLKFREHANQGEDALSNYLRMEGRMLRYRQERARKRAEGYLELLAELFIVVLVLPALLVIVLTVMSVLAPGLSRPVTTPLGSVSTRVIVVYGSAAFVVVVGVAGAMTVENLRPADQRVGYDLPDTVVEVVTSVPSNPASAGVVLAVPALAVGVGLALADVSPVNAGLLAYVAFTVPVGSVAVRRARIDDAKDREIKDFVHAVSEHVSLGRPFPEAVDAVARDVDLGALNDDVADLAFNLSLTTAAEPRSDPAENGAVSGPVSGSNGTNTAADLRTAALDRFVERVGTPLAEQSVGLVTGALNAGSDAEPVFETLQTEIGRLYHEKQALRSAMLVYVAVGWTTALLVVGIVVAVNTQVIDGFAQLSELSETSGFALDAGAVQPDRERFRFYVVTQATMLASGWFAGTASRGPYEALLHSGLLVATCYVVFVGSGMV
ncbi:type II secretion system F family protein [Halorubrum sp. DTA98]|uniref:type II secretion system F family protein n=1 Tax=Halorubrum sp. DTA98 TaxID=3402163 RepID=UPI003AABBF65